MSTGSLAQVGWDPAHLIAAVDAQITLRGVVPCWRRINVPAAALLGGVNVIVVARSSMLGKRFDDFPPLGLLFALCPLGSPKPRSLLGYQLR